MFVVWTVICMIQWFTGLETFVDWALRVAVMPEDLVRHYSNGVFRKLTVCGTRVRSILWAIRFFTTPIIITILAMCEHSQFYGESGVWRAKKSPSARLGLFDIINWISWLWRWSVRCGKSQYRIRGYQHGIALPPSGFRVLPISLGLLIGGFWL